jgi:hypothetical protein
MLEAYVGTWFEVCYGCFGTCLRHVFGTWFDAYHGDLEHMIWRKFLEILA